MRGKVETDKAENISKLQPAISTFEQFENPCRSLTLERELAIPTSCWLLLLRTLALHKLTRHALVR